MVKGLSCPEMRFRLVVQELKGEYLGSLAFVRRSERLSVSNICEELLQSLHVLMISHDCMLLEFLLLLDLFLIIVTVPKVIVASDMRKNGLHDCRKRAFVFIVNRQFHKIVLKMIVLKSYEFKRCKLLFDVLEEIGDEVYVEGCLSTEAGLTCREETRLQLLQITGKPH